MAKKTLKLIKKSTDFPVKKNVQKAIKKAIMKTKTSKKSAAKSQKGKKKATIVVKKQVKKCGICESDIRKDGMRLYCPCKRAYHRECILDYLQHGSILCPHCETPTTQVNNMKDQTVAMSDFDILKLIVGGIKKNTKNTSKHFKSFPHFYKLKNYSTKTKWIEELRRYVTLVFAHVMEGFHDTTPPRKVQELLNKFKRDFVKFIDEIDNLFKKGDLHGKMEAKLADDVLYDLGDEIQFQHMNLLQFIDQLK